MEISIPKTKAMHIHKKTRVSETTEDEIAAMGFKFVCPNCSRDFPTKRGCAIHQGRWCDGGKTERSRKGSLADKTVQHEKRKLKENELDHVTIEGQTLNNVYSFEYLGSRIQCDGDDKADVEYRMNIAQSVFNSLSHIWADQRISRGMRLRLYQTAVCSTFTHACEAWDFTDSVKKMVNGFNSRCLSRILNKEFRETATHPDFNLVALVLKRRLRFAGHILRMGPDRLLRRTFIAYLNENPLPPGSLLYGCDEMKIEEVSRLAQNRRAWSKFINSLSF